MDRKIKHIVSVVIKMIKSPYERFIHLDAYGFYNWMKDEHYLKKAWKVKMGGVLDLQHPKSFSEKLQWLKIHDRKPLYTVLVDKYAVKTYVSEKIGKEYVIPLLGVWEKFDNIDFNSLPEQFVLKCTHDSGGLVIVKDKNRLNKAAARKKINRCLKRNFYYTGREWPYKNVKPRIIAEPYLTDGSGTELKDYKFLCFHGEPRLVEVHQGRFTKGHTQDIYDMEWKKTPFTQGACADFVHAKPVNMDKMVQFSRKLSKNFMHIRVDWYEVKGHLYFGEFTFYDGSGLIPFDKYEDDLWIGSLLCLDRFANKE